jgi:WD40 repeat protein
LCLKTLEGHKDWVNSVAIKDNLIISGSNDKTIRITPITLFPNESDKFQQVINHYWLPEYLEQQLMDCFKSGKD